MRLRTSSDVRSSRRGGFVIVAVLMVIAVLSLAAYQYSALMDAEVMAAERIRKNAEAKANAESGIANAMALIADPTAFEGVLNSNPYDNQGSFYNQAVNDGQSPKNQGRFSLVSLDFGDDAAADGSVPVRYGLSDEAGKLNINALYALDTSGKVLHDALMKLPNMTDDIAWSIVDWIDPDEVENPGGAESEYYAGQSPPYQCKNAPLDTIEELLLVKGVTPSLLYGTDRNRNGQLDPGEDDGSGYSAGWAAYITVYSREPNVDSQGNPRINLNGNDLTTLQSDLTNAVGSDLATFLLGYRLFGTGSTGGTQVQGNAGGLSITISLTRAGTMAELQQKVQAAIASNTQPRQRISSLFALVSATITIAPTQQTGNQPMPKGGNGGGNTGGLASQISVSFASPLADKSTQVDLLGKLLDLTTTQQGTELPAKVNVNTAPRAVLLALPGLTDANVDAIIAKRPQYQGGATPDDQFKTIAWLISDNTLPPQSLQALERYITARTQVYRVQSIGYFDEGGPMARVEAVIDANQGKPRVVYYRDLTDLGRSIDPRNLNQ
jgi:type II secretory pathway component PulK